MTFDTGRKSVSTWTGTILSFLLAALVIGYFVSKLQVLILKTDTNITIATSQYHFTDEDIFGTQQGLGVAVAFVDHDFNYTAGLDRSYGELYFSRSEWGFDEDGEFFVERTRLETYPCTEEELNSSSELGKRFMPLHERNTQLFEKQKEFMCMKEEDAYVYGDFDSDAARVITILL